MKIIETERLILKGLTAQDLEMVFNNYTKEKFMELLGLNSEKAYQEEEHKIKNSYTTYNRSIKLFLICLKETGKIVGRGGFHNWRTDHNRAELGYEMLEDAYKKKGYMSEAVETIIQHGFEQLNIHRIEALVSKYNEASLRIMAKNNFIQEGIMRENFLVSGHYEDTIMFSLLKKEYEEKHLPFTNMP